MNKTDFLELNLPEELNVIEVEDLNENMQKLDEFCAGADGDATKAAGEIERLQEQLALHVPRLALQLQHETQTDFFTSGMLVADFSKAGVIESFEHVDFDGNKPVAPSGWAGGDVTCPERKSLPDDLSWVPVVTLTPPGAATITKIGTPISGTHFESGLAKFRIKDAGGNVLAESEPSDANDGCAISCEVAAGQTYAIEACTCRPGDFVLIGYADDSHRAFPVTFTATPIGYASGYVITKAAQLPKGRFSVQVVAGNAAPQIAYRIGSGTWNMLTLQWSEPCVNSDGQAARICDFRGNAVVNAGQTQIRATLSNGCRLDGLAVMKI